MSQALRDTFRRCNDQGRNALVTFITAGVPSLEETVPLMLALQAGGVDVIELGMPFSDPIADGPVIQNANQIALENNVNIDTVLDLISTGRAKGVHVPIVLMGYYNPVLHYGEEKLCEKVSAVGGNGFILVDLPPEEALRFRGVCKQHALSYVPLIAPTTPDDRIAQLASIADSFLYVVSRMGATGSSGSLDVNLKTLLERVRKHSGSTYLAVGFGVSTRAHFEQISEQSNGVVVGSHLIALIQNTPKNQRLEAVENYVSGLVGGLKVDHSVHAKEQAVEAARDEAAASAFDGIVSPGRYLGFGGQYVPEGLRRCLDELEKCWYKARDDPSFWDEFRSHYTYMGRPSSLYYADRLTEQVGGAKIWLKREDLNHTGSHKINNAMGQALIAKRLGKKEIIAETGAGQHGVATATVCAKFGLKCTVYMGAEDCRRQALNVFRMKMLGATVVPVENGTKTLRDACSEALRGWVTNLDSTHYILGSATGPHPFPDMVRSLQSVIGNEIKQQFAELNNGALPDYVVACVGGGSNCSGSFAPFIEDKSVSLLGIEAGGDGVDTGRHAATISGGSVGVLHGSKSMLLQDNNGQVQDTHSISAGLDYPGVGPELASWKASGRAEFQPATDIQAMIGFRILCETEGIVPAMESAHAIYGAVELAKTLPKDKHVVVTLSGRGDKDVQNVADLLPHFGPLMGWDVRF